MELEKTFKNNQFNTGYDLYKIKPEKEIELFFREALELSIKNNNLKVGDRIKLILLFEDTNTCTPFCKIQEDMEKVFEFMCNKENFNCIDFNIHFVEKGEFKIEVKWVKLEF